MWSTLIVKSVVNVNILPLQVERQDTVAKLRMVIITLNDNLKNKVRNNIKQLIILENLDILVYHAIIFKKKI
jgi:hypothetical protein